MKIVFMLLDIIVTNINLFNQISVKRLIRDIEEKETMRLLK